MRKMRLEIEGRLLYESFFDPKTGNTIRRTEDLEETVNYGGFAARRDRIPHQVQEKLREMFPGRYSMIPSPSPELVDVSITDRCTFGCPYCYQDSRPKRKHAPRDLVPTLLRGFETVPYQIAIGGGEPTGHPDFPWILQEARKLGTVPNYTTAGHVFRPEVIKATNEFCGGVALTYHAFKGLDWFKQTYRRWRKALRCQLNVHLIADRNVSKNLDDLVVFQDELGEPINLVLLAYYPDVGRASMEWLMTRTVYSQKFPESLVHAKAKGMRIAFSEGLLPFFLSRPELGIHTELAMAAEGKFSCYVDPKGYMWQSSFATGDPMKEQRTVFEESAQTLWSSLRCYGGSPAGEPCYDCRFRAQCATPHQFHFFTCAFASHNRLPLAPVNLKSRYEMILEDD